MQHETAPHPAHFQKVFLVKGVAECLMTKLIAAALIVVGLPAEKDTKLATLPGNMGSASHRLRS
jgi:hypothetical protein